MKNFHLLLILICLLGIVVNAAGQHKPVHPGKEMIIIQPAEDRASFTNPFSGWEIWAGKVYCNGNRYNVAFNTTAWGDDCPWFGGVLLDMYWKDIQPVDSATFKWDYMDSIVNYWYDRGKTFNIRLWCSWDPGWHSGANSCVPEWAQKKVAGLMTTMHPSVWVPLYSDPTYEKILWPRIKAFLQEFKKHYAGDKWSSFVQINNMAYGEWGEWWEGKQDGSPIPGTWGSAEKKKAVLERIIQDWYTVIDSEKYCHMAGCVSCGEEFVTDSASAMDQLGYRYSLPFGAGLSVNGYEGNNRVNIPVRSQLIDRYSPTNPGIGESNWLYQGPGSITSYNKFIIDFLKDFKTSRNDLAHWYAIATDYELMKKRDSTGIVDGLKAGGIGYRFMLKAVSYNKRVHSGDNLRISSVWVNQNVGKLNAKAPVQWFLTDQNGKVYCSVIDSSSNMNRRGNFWRMEGDHRMTCNFLIPALMPEGEYELRVAMINTTTRKIPYIKLAIKGKDGEGRYRIGPVNIIRR